MQESCFYHISPDGRLTRVATLDEAMALAAKEGFMWLDVRRPVLDELSALVRPLDLHPLSIEDCCDENQVPKIEDLPTNSFIIFNAISYVGGSLVVDEIDLFIGKDFVITVSGRQGDQRWPLSGLQRVIELDVESARQGPAFLLHVVLDYVVDQNYAAIETLEDMLDTAEDAVIASPESFHPKDLLQIRRDLLAVRKSLFHEREILVKICRKDCPFIPDKAILHYRDIYDHLAKFFELTETYRDVETSLMEMYLSMVNNQMAKTANETNSTVRRLTFITTIFMPLSLLAGIGGMSEWSMMTGPENWRIAYPAFMVLMVVLGLGNYYLLRRLER